MSRLLRARRTTDNRWDPDDVPWLIAGTAAILMVLGVLSFMLDYSGLDVWTGILVVLILSAASVPAFRWVAKKEGDPRLFALLFAGMLVKFAASMARMFMIEVIYGGSSDASRYHGVGVIFANRVRDGIPVHPIEAMSGFPVETQRIADLAGLIYTVTGPSQYVGFFVFAYACFWGQILMYRAFKVAVPEGDSRRYAWLVLFLPSLMFWPSSIGKEAVVLFCMGLTVYGGGLLLAPRPQAKGAAFFIAGTLLVLLVRPHVALMSVAGLVLAMAIGVLGGGIGAGPGPGGSSATDVSSEKQSSRGKGRAIRLGALLVLVVLASGVSSRLGDVMGEDGSLDSQSALEETLNQSSRGGSEFQPVAVNGPSQLPAGVISVFFRPFPWEATNPGSMIAGAESLLLLGLFAISWKRVLNVPRYALKRPFVAFCCVYALLFAIGFSYIGNFGILARQRVQALPVVLVMLALPPVAPFSLLARRGKAETGRAEESVGHPDSVTTISAPESLQEQGMR